MDEMNRKEENLNEKENLPSGEGTIKEETAVDALDATTKPNAKEEKKSKFFGRGRIRLRYRPDIPDLLLDGVFVTVLGFALGYAALWNAAHFRDVFEELAGDFFANDLILRLNILPVVFLALVIWLITGRAWISGLLSSAVVLAASWGNYFKLVFRDDPFVASDLSILREAKNISTRYDVVLTDWMKSELWIFGGSVLVLLAIQLFRDYRSRQTEPKAPKRWITVAIRVVTLVIFASGFIRTDIPELTSSANYVETRISDTVEYLEEWAQTDRFVSHGFVYPFIYSVKDAVGNAPEGYSEKEAKSILSEYTDADIPEDEKINVIAVMLEAYVDLREYEQIEFTGVENIYYTWDRLKEEGISGHLLTNSFAAGTTISERNFLTGNVTGSDAYYGNTTSFVRYFSSQGYYTDGGHAGDNWFYNRSNVNEWLGFDNYEFRQTRYGELSDENMIPDSIFLADVWKQYEERDKSVPYFGYFLTYQNHGPYSGNRAYEENFIQEGLIQGTGYDEAYFHCLNNYLGGLLYTNLALESLVESARESEEPVCFVFFGDHKPWMGNNGVIYEALGISLDRDTEEGFRNYYSTPYVIWMNDAAKAVLSESGQTEEEIQERFTGDGGDTTPSFLMMKLFDVLGWEGPAEMQLARWFRDNYATCAMKNDVFILADGTFTLDAPEEVLEAQQKLLYAQYYLKNHNKYLE